MEQTDDNKDSSTQETANKESQSKESQSKESQSKASQSKASQSKASQSKASQSKASQSKASQSKASQSKASQNKKSPKQLTFETLTPTNLSETEMQGYTQALDFIFKEDDLRNIAITGPYASGKSSVIKTYVNKHYKLKGIYISLAYFSPALESKIKGKKQDNNLIFEDELILERKIINQLIHQIDPNKIPDTEFKIKSELKKRSNIIWAGILSLMISYLIFIDKGSLINSQDEYFFLALFSLLVFLGLTTLVIDKIINLQNRKNLISKLKIFENEIDISSSACEVSYFDKYLNEILYILDESQLDYIVFEDIDRYDDNLILNKLRELNYIYNKKYAKNNPKPIKFFYLIKDEIFESKDRTKFFDYILPVVPVIGNANSLGKMEQIFKERNIRKDFSITLLDTLSLYLDDIRLIKNICNEYIIYKTKIAHNDSEFKNENLLAIIVYKNIFPADFSLTRLGLGQGVVHRIIDSLEKQKNEYYQEEIQKIDDENKQLKLPNKITEFIEIKQNEGIQIDELFEKHIKEKIKQPEYKAEYEKLSSSCYFPLLRVLIIQGYIDEYYSDLTSVYNEHGLPRNDKLFLRNIYECRSSGSTFWGLKLTKPELVLERLKKYKNTYFDRESVLNYSLLDYSLATSKIYKLDNLSFFISLLEPLHDNQVEFINTYLRHYYSLLEKEIRALAPVHNNTDIIFEKLSEIQTEIRIEIQKMETVLSLISVKERISQRAREAQELKAEAQKLKAEAQKLEAQKLEAQELEAQAQGLEALAQAQEALAQALEAQAQALEPLAQALEPLGIEELAQVQTQAQEALAQALEKLEQARYTLVTAKQEARYKPEYLGLLIQQLNQQFPLLWQQINLFDLKLYLYLLFIYSDDLSTLSEMNEEQTFKERIDNSADFLLIKDEWCNILNLNGRFSTGIAKISTAFKALGIKFKKIDQSTPQLLQIVEIGNHYVLNQANVLHILENVYAHKNSTTYIIQTLLELNKSAPVKSYFQRNPEELVLSITASDIAPINDNEETVLFILNHERISPEAKIAYIDKLSTVITELNQITDEEIREKLRQKQK
jgi:chemotaxis protein histidine kinase CheA